SGARPSRLRQWLVGAQIAGSTLFLAIAGLFAQSYSTLTTFDAGFARDRLVIADFDPANSGYDADQAARFTSAFADRVRAVPGVVDVALIDHAPFFIGFERMTTVSGKSYPVYAASDGYFRTMGIPIAEGREFE